MTDDFPDESERDIGSQDGEAHELPTEFLDDTSDSHAVWFGFWDALKHRGIKYDRYEEATNEPHYYQFGYILGWVLQVIIGILFVFAATAGI